MAMALLSELANRIVDSRISSQLAMRERFRTTDKARNCESLLPSS